MENKESVEDDGNHNNSHKEDNGNDADRENDNNLNKETETASQEGEGDSTHTKDEENSEEKEDSEMTEEAEEDCETELSKEKKEPDLFVLSSVNAYGSQEVRKIEDDPEKIYTVTSKCILATCTSRDREGGGGNYADSALLLFPGQTYIGCNWETKVKQCCYDSDIAEVSKL